jgi:lipopolysaccharide/colanic/teichoic acid biosynthesis glycosyltransferase
MKEIINLLYIGVNTMVVNQLLDHPRISLVVKEIVGIDELGFIMQENPDVILCERFFPNGDGLMVNKLLKEHPSLKNIPFILITSEHEEGLLKTSIKQKINDVYVLPIPSNEDLLSRIDFILNFQQRDDLNKRQANQFVGYRFPLSKRLFDITVASAALVLLSPVLVLVMIAIRIESKGKVYYTSTRVGRKPFNFYKFRSMRVGAEEELKKLAKHKNQYINKETVGEVDLKKPCPCSQKEGFSYCSPVLHGETYSICDTWYIQQKTKVEKTKPHFIKIPDDPRVTRVGKIIRNTSIDELPQLLNVIKGDMSIVGNRPLPVYEAEKLTNDIMSKRFLAPAGLTGLWQVEKRGRKGAMSDDERKQLDNQYADLFIDKKYSFLYDMRLIIKTLPVLVQKESV